MDADEIMCRIFGASLVEFRVASAKANEDHPGQSRYDFLLYEKQNVRFICLKLYFLQVSFSIFVF